MCPAILQPQELGIYGYTQLRSAIRSGCAGMTVTCRWGREAKSESRLDTPRSSFWRERRSMRCRTLSFLRPSSADVLLSALRGAPRGLACSATTTLARKQGSQPRGLARACAGARRRVQREYGSVLTIG